MTSDHEPSNRPSDTEEVHSRLLLPLLIPAGAFLFAVLAIYGLSRIFLDLRQYEVGDVNMAVPLATGVALAILGVAAYLASRPSVPGWQMGAIVLVAAALLTGGSIWSAVHEEETPEEHAVAEETPPPGENGDGAAGEVVAVELFDSFDIEVDPASVPAGDVTFDVTNAGNIPHNLRVIASDADPGSLPVSGGMVDEAQVDVVASTTADLPGGENEQVAASLDAGSYILICNVAGHYEAGMYVGFTVE
jgi:uncharacterized cupredoxin-like copper-binding protein